MAQHFTRPNVPKVISYIGTTPQERQMTTEEFKAKFDEMPSKLQDYLRDTLLPELDGHLDDYMPHDDKLNQYASDADENGIYRIVEFKRPGDGTLYMKSTLSNPDDNGNYQTVTWEFYDENGSQVKLKAIWTLTYDADGSIISKEVTTE